MEPIIDENLCSAEAKDRGRRFYERYARNCGNKNYLGHEMPSWPALTTAVRSHWCAVAVEAQKEMATSQTRVAELEARETAVDLDAVVQENTGTLRQLAERMRAGQPVSITIQREVASALLRTMPPPLNAEPTDQVDVDPKHDLDVPA